MKKQDFEDYLKAVFKHWYVLVFVFAFGALFGLEKLGRSIFGPDFQIPSFLWWAIPFLAISVAQFRAWLDIKKERDGLRRYDVTQETLKKVADYRQELVTFQNEQVKDDVALGAWRTRYEAKRKEITDFLSSNFSPAEASLFERFGTFDVVYLPGDTAQINPKYLQSRSMIIRDYRWLDELAKDYGRRRYRAGTEEDNDSTR